MVADMENGREWVERAVAHYSKTVKYTGDATKPNVGTVAYLTPVFLRDKEGLKYDGFKDNLYGINDMSM